MAVKFRVLLIVGLVLAALAALIYWSVQPQSDIQILCVDGSTLSGDGKSCVPLAD
ncbi:hypothetical protein FB468_0496 [Leucobacter komagatae]|uniref:Uncharacterized protein n=1 Tax=Leucobacter komagatae TaxID=55969 RepID=A0A542Y359_9MICO|nr:hypothetical protein FB468_0496 [Leucobacter komagatae]